VAEDGEVVTASEVPASKQPLRSTKPRLNGVMCIVLAVVLIAVSAAWFWVGTNDGAVYGAAVATLVLAILVAMIAVLAFRVAARPSGTLPLARPLKVISILMLVVGLVGAVLGIILGITTGSIIGVSAGVLVLFVSLPAAFQGALVYGAAKFRA
jgi:membrane-associated HD superfamily phosphohydrolase